MDWRRKTRSLPKGRRSPKQRSRSHHGVLLIYWQSAFLLSLLDQMHWCVSCINFCCQLFASLRELCEMMFAAFEADYFQLFSFSPALWKAVLVIGATVEQCVLERKCVVTGDGKSKCVKWTLVQETWGLVYIVMQVGLQTDMNVTFIKKMNASKFLCVCVCVCVWRVRERKRER